MTHAEQYSTSEPRASPPTRKKTRRRVISMVGLATTLGLGSAVISSTRPASADTESSLKAQAAAITAKIQATQGQIQALTGQVQSADFQLSQLTGEIAANQAEVAKDQAEVAKDQSQLRTQAIRDYTSSGTANQVTQMFSSNPNTSGIRSEYSSIATGNVTTTVDNLHTAQVKLQNTQSALQQQQTQDATTRDSLTSEESQATTLQQQDQSTLNSVNANIQTLVQQQQAAAAAAAAAAARQAFNAKLAAAQSAQAHAAAAQTAAVTAASSNSGGTRRRCRQPLLRPCPPVPAAPSRRPRANRRSLCLGWRDAWRRLRLLRPGPVGLGPGGSLAAAHLGCPVRRHHPHPTGRHRTRRPALLRSGRFGARGHVHRGRRDGRSARVG